MADRKRADTASNRSGDGGPLVTQVDRMYVAVRDAHEAARTFARLLDARPGPSWQSTQLGARCQTMRLGHGLLEICEPTGAGPVSRHLEQWDEGLLAMGLGTPDWATLREHLAAQSVSCECEDDTLFLPADITAGLPLIISPALDRVAEQGLVSGFYEATNTLNSPWQAAADQLVRLFRLDADTFCPIANKRFGYEGTLTLFRADQLDRIELSQTFADQPTAMRRFVERRGDSLYMCFVETAQFRVLKDRLLAAGTQLTARSGDIETEQDTVWVHPRHLHGMLLGVSRTDFAWIWSGKPDRVPSVEA